MSNRRVSVSSVIPSASLADFFLYNGGIYRVMLVQPTLCREKRGCCYIELLYPHIPLDLPFLDSLKEIISQAN